MHLKPETRSRPWWAALRDPVNGLLHLTALIVSLIGTGWLVAQAWPDRTKAVLLGIYGLGMSLTFLASSLHHLIRGTFQRELLYLKLDHAAIFLFIAGTYTPVCWYHMPSPNREVFLGGLWLAALVGIVYKLVFFKTPAAIDDPPEKLAATIYALMGLSGLLQPTSLLQVLDTYGKGLPLVGACCFLGGAAVLTTRAFDRWPGRFGHHEIWHVAVMAGSLCFFLYIARVVLPA